jgi:hypothetical protein
MDWMEIAAGVQLTREGMNAPYPYLDIWI